MARATRIMIQQGERLDRALYDRGVSYNAVAKKIGCSRNTIWEFCTRGTDISIYILMRVCAEYDISANYVLFGR